MQKEDWYISWFDHPFYEKVYAQRDDREAARLIDLVSAKYSPERFNKVLDMGCGRGRHSLLLAQKGYQVTGVDLSPEAIHKAGEAAKQLGRAEVIFDQGDMRTYRGEKKDLVCSFFTSFGYFPEDGENRSVLENMKHNLRSDGRLILDYLNPEQVRSQLIEQEQMEMGGLVCKITRRIDRDVVEKEMKFTGNHLEEPLVFKERVKLYTYSWFEESFKQLNMKVENLYGAYDGSPYQEAESSRMLMMVIG
ncbi:class I SAM-dependent methyltransferase [Balneolaceae bacterium ANBcel3]|nr:class I SAM-dependent methyltransferase [Balneolaceae bacterium ANBcel3]